MDERVRLMSIKQDNVATVTCEGNVCTASDGSTYTQNSDGSMTVAGTGSEDGTYVQVTADTAGAISINGTGTQYDGTSWLKQ